MMLLEMGVEGMMEGLGDGLFRVELVSSGWIYRTRLDA